MKQQKIFYIKYYLFHNVIAIVKSTIFKLKPLILLYFLKNYFLTPISKAFLTKHIKLFFVRPQFQSQF